MDSFDLMAYGGWYGAGFFVVITVFALSKVNFQLSALAFLGRIILAIIFSFFISFFRRVGDFSAVRKVKPKNKVQEKFSKEFELALEEYIVLIFPGLSLLLLGALWFAYNMLSRLFS